MFSGFLVGAILGSLVRATRATVTGTASGQAMRVPSRLVRPAATATLRRGPARLLVPRATVLARPLQCREPAAKVISGFRSGGSPVALSL